MSWDKERIVQIQLPDPADSDPPVSYTHLDVYKRQVIRTLGCSWKGAAYTQEKDLQLCFCLLYTSRCV